MSVVYNEEQVLALAPDDASVKAARKLTSVAKWPLLGANDDALWGECKGSGKKPYQVEIDLSEPAFKCSCPSRKFPCKHALALFLLRATVGDQFSTEPAPSWVTDWLDSRAARSEKKVARQQQKAAAAANPEAQKKRQAKRLANIASGLDDLALWLQDMLRAGLAQVQAQPASYWSDQAARLVDCQASGLASYVEAMHGVVGEGDDWPSRLLAMVGKLNLVICGFRRFESLPKAQQADLRAVLGWAYDKDELLGSEPAVRDLYQVLGTTVTENNRIREQRIWLQGAKSGRYALLLNFAYGNGRLDVSCVPGTAFDAELVYYPSAVPMRAIVKERFGAPVPMTDVQGHERVTNALEAYAGAVAGNPWMMRTPWLLDKVVPVRKGRWYLVDREGRAAPIRKGYRCSWELAASSGGEPISVFGEWRAGELTPLSCWAASGYVHLPVEGVG